MGRLEVRDWVDVLACHERLQPLGYVAWAACGKDPGFSPLAILDLARRSARYTQEEVDGLDFEGVRPRAGDLSARWREAMDGAAAIVAALPPARVGEAVLTAEGALFTGPAAGIATDAAAGRLQFHRGRLGGAWPTIGA